MRGEYEMHHTNWTRRAWSKAPDFALRKMRNHAGLIVPIHHDNHRLLHWELEPTPMPTHEVAVNLLEEIGEFKPGDYRVDTFTTAASFLISEAMSDPHARYAESAHKLGTHYIAQLGFLAMNEELAASALRENLLRAA